MTKKSLKWRIKEGQRFDERELPILRYIIQYQRAEDDNNNNNYPRKIEITARNHGKTTRTHRKPPKTFLDNHIIHEITGLIQDTEYSFHFMTENAAGISESYNRTISTLGNEENSSNKISLVVANLFLSLLILLSLS